MPGQRVRPFTALVIAAVSLAQALPLACSDQADALYLPTLVPLLLRLVSEEQDSGPVAQLARYLLSQQLAEDKRERRHLTSSEPTHARSAPERNLHGALRVGKAQDAQVIEQECSYNERRWS